MGHTGTGPRGSSNDPSWNRHPEMPELSPQMMAYQPEIWAVPKDTIYAAATAIELALGYMPLIKTDVPQWQKTVEHDIVRMRSALEKLQKLGSDLQSSE